MIREDSTRGCFQDRRARNRRRGWCSLLCRPIPVCRAVANGIVGAAIGRPPTNCNAICWFSAGKQSVIAFRRCDFVSQNHPDERSSPLRCLTKRPNKRGLADCRFLLQSVRNVDKIRPLRYNRRKFTEVYL